MFRRFGREPDVIAGFYGMEAKRHDDLRAQCSVDHKLLPVADERALADRPVHARAFGAHAPGFRVNYADDRAVQRVFGGGNDSKLAFFRSQYELPSSVRRCDGFDEVGLAKELAATYRLAGL